METKKRILIVDDEPAISKIFGFKLKLTGYDVVSATSGAEAVELVRSQHLDLMLLDILMPDMLGTDVIEQVRTFSRIPILVFSANQHLIDTALKIGADGAVAKPVDPEQLVKIVMETLAR